MQTFDQSEADLETRINSFELAYRMQQAAPEALDINLETQEVHDLYGIGVKECDHFAKQCLTRGEWSNVELDLYRFTAAATKMPEAGMGYSISKNRWTVCRRDGPPYCRIARRS